MAKERGLVDRVGVRSLNAACMNQNVWQMDISYRAGAMYCAVLTSMAECVLSSALSSTKHSSALDSVGRVIRRWL